MAKKSTKDSSKPAVEEAASPPRKTAPQALKEPESQSSRLNWIFDYHKPTEDQVDSYNQITAAAKELARVILNVCPLGADRSAALRKVREAKMTANSSIALHGEI